ncbi:MAG TPA: LysR family transcriptional regulator [Naasia sp.]
MTDSPLLSRLDLNLLVALDALLTEKSVTRAAERLHLSQPALSASLARLRTHFNDPVLARRGNTYELTPLALRLAEHTTTALDAARRVFESQASWTPHESTREFTVYGSDYGFATIGPILSQLAAEKAPGVRFRFILHSPPVVEDAANRLRSVDAMVIPHGYLTDLPYKDLWRDRWVILASSGNPGVGESITMDDLATSPWVFTYQSRSAFTSAARQLQQLGIEPHVEAVVESFLALPHFIAGSNRLGLIQSGLAGTAERLGGVRVLEPPFDATPILNALWWHPVHNRDPEHAWMRTLFEQAARIAGSTVRGELSGT